jgi:hypothetical protein
LARSSKALGPLAGAAATGVGIRGKSCMIRVVRMYNRDWRVAGSMTDRCELDSKNVIYVDA